MRSVCVHGEVLLSAYWQSSTLCLLVGVQCLAYDFREDNSFAVTSVYFFHILNPNHAEDKNTKIQT